MIKVKFTRNFTKQYKKAPKKVKVAFNKRLAMFMEDKQNPLLNNHPLIGKLQIYRSINITGDWRALFREFENEELVFFEFLGTHSQLYK